MSSTLPSFLLLGELERERKQRDGSLHVQTLLIGCNSRLNLSWIPFLVYLKRSLDDGSVRGGSEREVEGSVLLQQVRTSEWKIFGGEDRREFELTLSEVFLEVQIESSWVFGA